MRIGVSGIGVVSAIGIGVESNLASLALSRDGLGAVTAFETVHKMPVGEVKASDGELKDMLSLPGNRTYSRTALLGMAAAAQAMTDSGADTSKLRIGIVSATSVGGMDLTEDFYKEFIKDPAKGRLRYVASHDCCDSTSRIAQYCGIDGFQTTVSTACSSAANAIILGARMIRHGYADAMLVGGTDALCRFTLNGFNSLMILDPGKSRPFDNSRCGLNLGEGAGYLLLQSEQTMTRTPYCFLAGYANANDAFHQTASSASGDGAYLAMKGALEKARMQPEDIDYLNAHGTGTPNNDASEGAAIVRLWGAAAPVFSSTKPFTGHALAAAGGIEAVLSVLSVHKGIIYPNLNFVQPIEGLGLVPQTEYAERGDIRAVMSNSFGFGGNNSSLIFAKDK